MKSNRNYQVQQPPKMYQQVITQLVEYIESEQLSEGSKIPTERNLSELLGVSRSSIREGIRSLELLGYLDSRQGEGTFVSNPPPFLIPPQLLKQQLDHIYLQNYYEVFIMCSKQIVSLSLSQGLTNKELIEKTSVLNFTGDFWSDFPEWIEFIATGLQNPFFLSLWSNNYNVLVENDYFCTLNLKVQFNVFLDCYLERNEARLKELFHGLSKLDKLDPI
ncbi:FadR/GntR family transcriptional regulator [Peribacillus frigoritolerans]|uniref:FadR/GntR family transcriptional regulator n=1 Tax=Peribacillus frigoritolerans TaxID=450367 RepID=UPI00227F7CA2|nr:GntR family transcriptional regulator [Peribacillus frigoritolerans]MCY9002439.1 GntR family transcriptional regulator [Peribacillus frigoritolerans]